MTLFRTLVMLCVTAFVTIATPTTQALSQETTVTGATLSTKTAEVVFPAVWHEYGDQYRFTVTVSGNELTYKALYAGGCSFTVPIMEQTTKVIKGAQYDGCTELGRTYNNIFIEVRKPTPDGDCRGIRWKSFDGRGNYVARGKCTSG